MSARRHVLFLAGLALVIVLVAMLPDDVYGSTQGFLVAAAALVFLLLALGVFLVPVRRALGRLFGFETSARGVVAMAGPDEWRDLVRPLFSGLVCLAVAGVSALLRPLF